MGKKTEEDALEEDVIQQETSSEEEELSYDDEFDKMYGSGEEEEEGDQESTEEEEEEPEEEAAEEEEEQEATPEEKPPVKQEPNDPYKWINDLPEEVREQAKSLRHAAESHHGRAAAFQRRSEELQAELDRNRRQTQPAEPQGKPEESAAPELPKEFEKLKEDFPEFAEAVDAIRAYDRQQWDNRIKEQLEPLNQMKNVQAREAFNRAVTTEAEEIFKTKETGVTWSDIVNGDDFRAWLSDQPKSVQQAARTPDPAEAVYVLRRYEDDYQRAVKAMDTETTEAQTQKSHKADTVQQKRSKRQAAAVGPGSKPAPVDSAGGGGDYEDEFNRQWG